MGKYGPRTQGARAKGQGRLQREKLDVVNVRSYGDGGGDSPISPGIPPAGIIAFIW